MCIKHKVITNMTSLLHDFEMVFNSHCVVFKHDFCVPFDHLTTSVGEL
jgi:hypothetical protein